MLNVCLGEGSMLLTGTDDGGLETRSTESRAGAALRGQKLRPTNVDCFTSNIILTYT